MAVKALVATMDTDEERWQELRERGTDPELPERFAAAWEKEGKRRLR